VYQGLSPRRRRVDGVLAQLLVPPDKRGARVLLGRHAAGGAGARGADSSGRAAPRLKRTTGVEPATFG